MAKPVPERLELASYFLTFETAPRFGDLDPLRHLNNAALVRIYEDARVRFLDGSGVREAWEPHCRFVVAEMAIQYLAEGGYPDPLSVGSGVLRIGRSSFTLAQGLFQNGRCIGVGDTTMVYVDTVAEAPRALPEAARARLDTTAMRVGFIRSAPRSPDARTSEADFENA